VSLVPRNLEALLEAIYLWRRPVSEVCDAVWVVLHLMVFYVLMFDNGKSPRGGHLSRVLAHVWWGKPSFHRTAALNKGTLVACIGRRRPHYYVGTSWTPGKGDDWTDDDVYWGRVWAGAGKRLCAHLSRHAKAFCEEEDRLARWLVTTRDGLNDDPLFQLRADDWIWPPVESDGLRTDERQES
jgi:hypothetical protein